MHGTAATPAPGRRSLIVIRFRPAPRIAVAVALLTGVGTGAAPVSAAPLGFSDAAVLGAEQGTVSATAAAIGPTGAAVIAASGFTADGGFLRVHGRSEAGAPWRPLTLALGVPTARDPQVAVAPGGRLLVAWAQAASPSGGFRLKLADVTGGRLRLLADRTVQGTSEAAIGARLAVTAPGTTLLAWRDGRSSGDAVLRVAALPRGARRLGSARTIARGVSSVAITAAGGGATLAWTRPAPAGTPREARALRLRNDATPRDRPALVTRTATSMIRLTGSPSGRTYASWLRRRSGTRPAVAFTRSLLPFGRPAQAVTLPGDLEPTRPAAVAAGSADERTLAAVGGTTPTQGFAVQSALQNFGGVWHARRTLTDGFTAMVGSPHALRTPTRNLVVFAAAAPPAGPIAGPPPYDIRVAQAPSGRSPEGAVTVATGLRSVDGRGTDADAAGERILVTWPAPGGGVAHVER